MSAEHCYTPSWCRCPDDPRCLLCKQGRCPVAPAEAAQDAVDAGRVVFAVTRYSQISNTWSEWPDKTFEEVVAAVAERAQDRKANGHPTEVVEAVIVRRAIVRADITVEEIAVGTPTGADQ